MTDRKRHGFILLLVAGLIAASFVFIATKKTRLGLDLKGGVELTYRAEATPESPVNPASLQRAVDVMNNRVNQLGVAQPQITTEGKNLIDVQLPDVKNVAQAEAAVGNTAQLFFYDWETNVLTPSGQPAANGLETSDPASLTLSQGTSTAPPGSNTSATGAMGFYAAVQLAAKQPLVSSGTRGQGTGNQFFLFGAPGSSACAAYAAASGTKVQKGVHCLISSVQVGTNVSAANAAKQLKTGLPAAETTGTKVLEVKQGTQVLQGVPSSYTLASWPKYGSPDAGYYVIRDNVALRGDQISNPEASTDQSGAPDVTFGFKDNGGSLFQNVTAKISQRGLLASTGGQQLNQHFAIALDNQLVSVPQIDYQTFPEGIPSTNGSEITGGFTASTAQALATQLRLGALPVKLVQISESQVSATLGTQALHQGLRAGVVGLAVVILLLLSYYRVLGLIATGGLLVYGIYFYALIKLIPITMTLAGIAGLILTIGVAADANIVIFERVKEEIRAGRTIRQGIITGYRKGVTAIIDANVVTILTAFILFVLATSDVKGFAFTLGIGTFVSLFTAVLATQAILMTMGDSRVIQSPSALGAGGNKRHWRFDFMGSSRYFFSMSGVILMIGALAIGGRGLNLGIDFTGGTQISVGLQHKATVTEMKSLVAGVGGGDATIQAVSNAKTLGPNGFQISSKYLGQSQYEKLRSEIENKYGIRGGTNGFNTTSVGPAFGSTVTKSAVIAIIVSLLVISLYVALRFEWKFTIPVLIALMHDLLITAGVYALTGRVVTADTVAALLTILGYSLYDTIIVFDRVRENIPRMPRAAFSQIVNRSMSEVLTRSLMTTSCTLLPVIALLLFGGTTLKDFAFALLIGVASGAYSSIFIASPVLTHWKEREHGYTIRRERIIAEVGYVPPYADGGDVEPTSGRVRPTGRLTTPQEDSVSAAEFEQMKRDLGLEESEQPRRRPSRLTERTAHTAEEDEPASPSPARRQQRSAAMPTAPPQTPEPEATPPVDAADEATSSDRPVTPAPDEAENEGVAEVRPSPTGPRRPRPRNRRHGRKR
ncbi:MAG TPA: protein translocase subunit SecD [Solirubrobacteraceae bacterium]|jgi:SecD/SecF fusion protein|nr:protein translocase subunit SecD [Solirubrobacteraceae bacterium]